MQRNQEKNTKASHNISGKSKTRRFPGICVCGLLCLALGFNTYALTGADEEIQSSRDKIAENKQKLNELNNKKSDITGKIEELNKLKSDAAAYIRKLDDELKGIEANIEDLNGQIDGVSAQIETTTEELKEVTKQEDEQYSSMKLRIKYMYEHGGSNVITTLLQSGSLSELLNKAEYVSNVSDYDRRKLDEYVDIRQQKETKEQELTSEKELLEATVKTMEDEKAGVEKLQDEKSKEVSAYNAKISEAESDIAEMSEDIAGIKRAIQAEENNIAAIEARIKAEEERKRQEAAQKGETYKTTTIGDISFIWPCPASSRITSNFGDRESPVEGASTNHKGVDIGCLTGEKVIAAAAGSVVISTYSESAGNYIMISHGGGVYTVYMHMSSLGVSVGDTVSQGQTIGKVGSTGYSSGPHLHFGIRVNGNYVNPLGYVSP